MMSNHEDGDWQLNDGHESDEIDGGSGEEIVMNGGSHLNGLGGVNGGDDHHIPHTNGTSDIGSHRRNMSNDQDRQPVNENRDSTTDQQRVIKLERRLRKLEQECREKNAKIKQQSNAIEEFTDIIHEKKDELVQQSNVIDKARMAHENEIKNLKKRFRAKEAEMKLQQDELREEQKSQLEQVKKDVEEENKKVESKLEADKALLETELEVQKNKTKECEAELAKANNDHDDLRRLRDSFARDLQKLEVKIKTMENEFGLESQGEEF